MSDVFSRISEMRILRRLAAVLLPERTRSTLWAMAHDHYVDPSEQFYGRIYLSHLSEVINANMLGRRLRVLDLGCGHGRFSIPLAKLGHDVVGVDKNEIALGRARKHAAQLGVRVDFRNLDFWSEELGQFDLAIAIETLRGSLDEVLKLVQLATRCLSKNGLFAISVRTRYYQMAESMRRNDFQHALAIALRTEKARWLEPSELQSILLENGYKLVRIVGIGVASGLRLDPFAALSVPANLTSAQKEMLEKIEMQMGSVGEVIGCGRYMFAIAKKEDVDKRTLSKS